VRDPSNSDRIELLLNEAYNERMHLLTFLTMAQPGWFMKIMVLGAQGVLFNGMFLAYMVSPRTCDRLDYLDEEAVRTYTYAIQDIEEGRLSEWSDLEALEIAIRYWQMPEGQRNTRDLLLNVRADEARHSEVNHTLVNLQQA
jgi:predicted DNA-binding protein